MQVYDKIILETKKILEPYSCKHLPVNVSSDWKMLDKNEFLLRNEVAFELGNRTLPSTCYQALTSNELINKDEILLYGPDLQEIDHTVPFTRITFLNVDDIKNQDEAYRNVKRLEFARFRFIPEGYMILSSSMDNKEEVRVSKKAIQEGLNFTTIGNLLIDHYKNEYHANHVQVIFITHPLDCIDQLISISKKVDDVTNAFDHILKNIILDCNACPLHPICDDVDELRKLHFDIKNESNE